ncbi:MAG: hypothetical protein ACI3T9_04675 [Romboutsia timonensis]
MAQSAWDKIVQKYGKELGLTEQVVTEKLDKYHFYDVQTFKPGSEEKSRLEKVASILTKGSGLGRKYTVEDTWMDYGSQLAWTTIVYQDPDNDYKVQILSPRDWADILNAENDDELNDALNALIEDEYWSDTVKVQPDQEVDIDTEVEEVKENLKEDWEEDNEQETFFDMGSEFVIDEILDSKEVDGYTIEIAKVHDVDNGSVWYEILLEGDPEWGPEDTYEGAKAWFNTVEDGYYTDDESKWSSDIDDNFEADDDYSEEDLKKIFGESVSIVKESPVRVEKTMLQQEACNIQESNEIKADPSFNDYDDDCDW